MEPIRSFSELIEGLTEMVERTEGAPERIDGTFRLIERALAGAEDLELGRFVPGKRSYARHLIHRDPQERFTLLGLVWRPGQGTPVHDHPSWGVVGVIRNRMKFVNYLLDDEEATSRLRVIETFIGTPGSVATVHPPYSDIHRMENPSSERISLSLHCYGCEVTHFHVYNPETGERRSATTSYDSVPDVSQLPHLR